MQQRRRTTDRPGARRRKREPTATLHVLTSACSLPHVRPRSYLFTLLYVFTFVCRRRRRPCSTRRFLRRLFFSRRDSTCRRRRSSSSSSSSSSLSPKHTIPWCDRPLGTSPNGPFSLYLYCTRVVNIVVVDTRKTSIPWCDRPSGPSPNDGLTSCVCRCSSSSSCST